MFRERSDFARSRRQRARWRVSRSHWYHGHGEGLSLLSGQGCGRRSDGDSVACQICVAESERRKVVEVTVMVVLRRGVYGRKGLAD